MNYIAITVFSALLLSACGTTEKDHSHETTNMVSQSELDIIIIENGRLKSELIYEQYRSEQNGGTELLLLQAEYHADRGEHTLAQAKIDKVKEKHSEGPHAEKAAELEAELNADRGEAVPSPDSNEHIETDLDDVHGITWYYDKRIPRDPDTTSFYLYMGHKVTGAPWLRMHAQYAGDHWLYLKEIVLKGTDLEWRMGPDPRLIFTTSGDLFCAEWNDAPPTFEEIRMIKTLLAEPELKIKFIGAKEHFERPMTDNEKLGIINILDLYNSMVRLEELEAGI